MLYGRCFAKYVDIGFVLTDSTNHRPIIFNKKEKKEALKITQKEAKFEFAAHGASDWIYKYTNLCVEKWFANFFFSRLHFWNGNLFASHQNLFDNKYI